MTLESAEYFVPMRATQRVFPRENLSNQKIFDYLIDHDFQYEAREDGIFVPFEDSNADDIPHEYEVVFTPEENRVTIHSEGRIDAVYLSTIAEKFSPKLFDYDAAEILCTYSVVFDHPSVTFDMLADLVDGTIQMHDMDGHTIQSFSHEYDGREVKLFEDGMIIPSDPTSEFLYEYLFYCDKLIREAAPPTPDVLDIRGLPEGWVSPLLLRHPELEDIVEDLGLSYLHEGKYTPPIADYGLTPNQLSIMLLGLIGSIFHAVDQTPPAQRRKFYDEIGEMDAELQELFLDERTDEVLDKEDFVQMGFWGDPRIRESIYEEQREYAELGWIADSYDDLDLAPNDRWVFDPPGVEAEMIIKLESKKSLEEKEFPHKPVWTAEIISIRGGDVEGFNEGGRTIVSGTALVDRVKD